MQHKINILYIGLHAEIRELVVKLINKNEAWQGTGAASPEEVMECLHNLQPELALLGNGLSEEQENEMRVLLRREKPSIKIIQHYGGGSGLLNGEIREALSREPQA